MQMWPLWEETRLFRRAYAHVVFMGRNMQVFILKNPTELGEIMNKLRNLALVCVAFRYINLQTGLSICRAFVIVWEGEFWVLWVFFFVNMITKRRNQM